MAIVLSSNASVYGLANYGDLKDAVARWLNKTNLTDDIPIFVRLAETMIRRDVRVRVQEQFVNQTAATETIPTPERFLEARRLIVGRQKDYIPPEMFQDMDAASGRGDYFTVIGEEIYILGGALDKPYSLLYWREFEAFDADNDTNWLLQNAPGVYLWSSCKEGAEYLKDFEAADRFNSKYLTELAALNASEKAMRHSGSQLRTRVGGSTP